MNEDYKTVGCVALKDGKGNYSVVVPVYVNMADVDRQAFEESENTIIERVTTIIKASFETQIANFISNKIKEAQNARKK